MKSLGEILSLGPAEQMEAIIEICSELNLESGNNGNETFILTKAFVEATKGNVNAKVVAMILLIPIVDNITKVDYEGILKNRLLNRDGISMRSVLVGITDCIKKIEAQYSVVVRDYFFSVTQWNFKFK